MVVLKAILAIFGTAEVNISIYSILHLSAGQHSHDPADSPALKRSTERTCLIFLSMPNVLATDLELLEQACLSVLSLGITSCRRMIPPDWVRYSCMALFQLTMYLTTAFIAAYYQYNTGLTDLSLFLCDKKLHEGRGPTDVTRYVSSSFYAGPVFHIKVLNRKFSERIGTK